MSGAAWFVASLAGAVAGAWVAYWRWKDKRHPEPLPLVLVASAAGLFSVGAAFVGYNALDAVGDAPSWARLSARSPDALLAALEIGLVEEFAKLLPVLPIAFWSRHFDEIWDGPVYLAASSIGFSLAETVVHLHAGGVPVGEGIARALAAPITHALFAAPTGLGLAHAVLHRRRWALALGLGVSAVVHGAYDLLLAQPGLQLYAAGLVGALWLWLLWVGRELVLRPQVER